MKAKGDIDAAGVFSGVVNAQSLPKLWLITLDAENALHRLASRECLIYGQVMPPKQFNCLIQQVLLRNGTAFGPGRVASLSGQPHNEGMPDEAGPAHEFPEP